MHHEANNKKPRLTKGQDKVLSHIIGQMATTNGEWEMPWHRLGRHGNPTNTANSKAYRGFNRLALMLKQIEKSYTNSVWGTLRQWNSRRSKVLAGEKAVTLFYPVFRKGVQGEEHLAYFRPFWVFNGNQVSNFNPDHPDLFEGIDSGNDNTLPSVEDLIEKHKIAISFGGDAACYYFLKDCIAMPKKRHFKGSATCDAEEAFYGTLLHEMIHWTGHGARLNRPHHQQWGDDVYAFEELIAEIGAAFICCDYGITNEPREDHAKYLNSWLGRLDKDKSQLWKAASKAQKAVDFLVGYKDEDPLHDHEKPPAFALDMPPTQAELFLITAVEK